MEKTITSQKVICTYCLNLFRIFLGGVPTISWIFDIWSSSFDPGKRGWKLETEQGTELKFKFVLEEFIFCSEEILPIHDLILNCILKLCPVVFFFFN